MNVERRFVLTDVFGKSRYAGNQLATFLNCMSFSEMEMQRIAREINFSETTFITSGLQENGGFNVRIFTPGAEVDFAGHPTLGTAFVIRKYLLPNDANQIILNLNVGQVPVTFQKKNGTEILWMKQISPDFGNTYSIQELSKILQINEDAFDLRMPIQEVSTGLPAMIVPLMNKSAVSKVNINREAYWQLINKGAAKVILVFAPGGYEFGQDLSVRIFPIAYGIDEDPATGSGNGCLAAYLLKHRYFHSDQIDVTVGQGFEMGRPSELYLKAGHENGSIAVQVGGQVHAVAKGQWEF